jgi:hypothetical protein
MNASKKAFLLVLIWWLTQLRIVQAIPS